MQRAIPATLMRGGTSKGIYFRAKDLPADKTTRDRVLLSILGSPDIRQIDGMGGAHPLTSKVAILSPPTHPDADIDYLFLQVGVDKATVQDGQTCGNLLAGVGAWAIEHGFVEAHEEETTLRVHLTNTGALTKIRVSTPEGAVQ
ncbi:MAG: PrpF domain-containing protein, partial [Pseudomonadota bacterium]